MALTEQRIINQVSILPNQSAINVQWADQILSDGEVIQQQYHRKAYTADQRDDFLAEVDGAEAYVSAVGW